MARPPGRPPTGRPRRVTVTTTQPTALMELVRGFSREHKVSMSRIWERAMTLYLKRVADGGEV